MALALLAGACVAPAAFAQALDPADPTIFGVIRKEAPTSYGDRINQLVYSTPLSAGDWRFLGAGTRRAGDDCSMVPGPGSGGNIGLNGAFFGCAQPAGDANSSSITVRVHIFDALVGAWAVGSNPAGGAADVSNANWLGTMTYDLANFNTPGYITFFDVAVTPTSIVDRVGTASSIIVPDTGFYAQIEICEYQTTNLHPSIYPYGRGTSVSIVAPGSTDAFRFADNNNDGLVTAGDIGTNRMVYLGFQGDVPPPPAPANTDLGCLTDAGLTQSLTLANNTISWYRICLNGEATDAFSQFLDIDTEGSAANVAISLFGEDGVPVGFTDFDDDDGSGTNAQLSYGIGRRAAVGDGRQYDGRDGELLAGVYYLAVGPSGSSFGPGFSAAANGGTGGAVAINFKTNTNSGALDASVAPQVFATDAGQLIAPGAGGTAATTERNELVWHKFDFCGTNGGTSYLDIDFSLIANPADSEAFLFDSAGNLVWSEDDGNGAGGYYQPQASFGTAGARTYSPVAGQPAFDGGDGELPAGTYYLAIGLYNATATGSRWHVRSDSGSSLTVTADYYTDSAGGCSGGGCSWQADGCFSDYDNNGGIDGDDVIAFFADWDAAGACADVDASGGVDGDDVILFFGAWDAGGVGFPGC